MKGKEENVLFPCVKETLGISCKLSESHIILQSTGEWMGGADLEGQWGLGKGRTWAQLHSWRAEDAEHELDKFST